MYSTANGSNIWPYEKRIAQVALFGQDSQKSEGRGRWASHQVEVHFDEVFFYAAGFFPLKRFCSNRESPDRRPRMIFLACSDQPFNVHLMKRPDLREIFGARHVAAAEVETWNWNFDIFASRRSNNRS